MRLGIAVLVLAIWIAAPAAADFIVINNGLAPPNPANVIDADNSFPDDYVSVHNVGCDAFDCPMPWGDPTSVEMVEGGVVSGLRAHESSTVSISGGWALEGNAFDSSTVTMSGGLVVRMWAEGSSTFTMSGGAVGDVLHARGSSTVTISGGSVNQTLLARESSTVSISGGFHSLFFPGDSSTVTMSGGSVLSLVADYSSTVSISGGSVREFLAAYDSSTVTMSGGSVGEAIRADDSSTITVLGTRFAVDGVSVSFGPIAAMSGTLTGTLESGEPIDSYFCHSGCEDFGQPHTGLIALVPEPDAALLFPVAVLSLAAVRRLRAS